MGIIDIDNFKSINDSLGHLYGDDILVLIAQLPERSFTRSDYIVFRYSGEEFVVIARSSDKDHARAAFECLRHSIESYQFPQLEKVTGSVGLVEAKE